LHIAAIFTYKLNNLKKKKMFSVFSRKKSFSNFWQLIYNILEKFRNAFAK